MEEKFTKHLIENGVIDKKTEYQILSFYKQRYLGYQYNKIKFNELMTEILITLFNNFSEIQKKYMCFHLPVKFIKLSENKLTQKLHNIILKKSLRIKIILYKHLFRWYKNIYQIKKNSSAYINNKNTFRQRKNIHLNTDYGENNKNGNIDRYINEYFLFNNIMRNDSKNKKNDKKNYFTLSNERRSRTYNNPMNKDNQSKLEKKLNLNFKYEESIPTDKDLNKIIAKNIKNKRNYKKAKISDNYFNNNNTGESIINQISRVNDNTISSLCDIKDFIMNSNNNTISKKYNKTEKPFSEKYMKDLNIMNAYNMKAYNNIGPKISQCNIRKNINKKDDLNKEEKKYLNKITNKNNLIQNLIDEDIEKNNSSFTRITKTPKMNRINRGYFDDVIYYSNKKNRENDKYSNILNPKFNQNIKQSHSNTHFTTYNRLFEDSKTRIRNQNRKRKEQEKYLDNLSNQISKEKKKVNFDRINYLYRNDDRKNNMEKTKTKVESEEGLTFKPLIYKSEYDKRIYSNFMERNYSNNKDNRDKFLNEFNYANNLNINTHKKMSKKQKERIIKGFIDRTNANSLIKSMSSVNKKNNKSLKNNRDIKIQQNKL